MDGKILLNFLYQQYSCHNYVALVKGFISLPSDMIPDSTEVLFELSEVAKEVMYPVLLVFLGVYFMGAARVEIASKFSG